MHWIINAGLRRETGFFALMDQIERQGQAHTLVHKPPLVEYLVDPEDPVDSDGRPKPYTLPPIAGPAYVVGTVSMKAISLAHGWTPGFIDAPSNREAFSAWDGHMLNGDAAFVQLGDVVAPATRFFIRPDADYKGMPGKVMEPERFDAWRANAIADPVLPISADLEVMVAPLRPIWSEYRCIVIDGRYVTGSRYKLGGVAGYSPDVGDRIVRFVEERIAEWNPRLGLAIDVADTPDGLKVIETNAISSAGFYAIDMARYVTAIAALG